MITAEQIPDEVVEKVAKCLCDEEGFVWDAYPDVHQYWKREAIKLIVSGLSAWPDMRAESRAVCDVIVLPIREKRDE